MECTKTWNTGLYDVTIGLLVSSACAAVYSWLPLDLTGKTTLPELPDAVVGGHEKGSPTYVARVMRDGFWELGKLNNWARFGYSVHGVEVEVPEGEVLVSNGAHVSLHRPCWPRLAQFSKAARQEGLDSHACRTPFG